MPKLKFMEWAHGGAGCLGSIEVGAVAALWNLGVRPSFTVGTSAGSIVAGLLALGKQPAWLKTVVMSANYAKLIPMNPWMAPFRGYLASNQNVIAWLRDLTGDQLMGDCEIPFIAVCSDLQTGVARLWSSELTPDMPVWQAILASMSIPDVFPEFEGRYVDGGLVCNIPVQYLPGKNPRLGLMVHEYTKIGPVKGFIDKQSRLIGMGLSAGEHDIEAWSKSAHVPIIRLPAGHLNFLDTKMTQVQKQLLYEAGFKAVMQAHEHGVV